MEHGNKMDLKCSNCSRTHTVRINKIYTKTDKTLFLTSGLILFLGTGIILYFFREIILNYEMSMGTYIAASTLLIPIWIYIILRKKDSLRIKTFNQTYVKD